MEYQLYYRDWHFNQSRYSSESTMWALKNNAADNSLPIVNLILIKQRWQAMSGSRGLLSWRLIWQPRLTATWWDHHTLLVDMSWMGWTEENDVPWLTLWNNQCVSVRCRARNSRKLKIDPPAYTDPTISLLSWVEISRQQYCGIWRHICHVDLILALLLSPTWHLCC